MELGKKMAMFDWEHWQKGRNWVIFHAFANINFSNNSFRITIKVSNSFDPDQDQHLLVLIWDQTVCTGCQHTTKFAPSKQRVKPLCQTSM